MIEDLETMSEDEIVAKAIELGYTVRDAPQNENLPHHGKRIGGSQMKYGSDEWMNAANVRLWEIQKSL